MKLAFLLLLSLVLAVSSQGGQDETPEVPGFTVTTVTPELAGTRDITHAAFHVAIPDFLEAEEVVGILVLCSGQNDDGLEYLYAEEWMQFARNRRLAVAGVYLKSPDAVLLQGGGYFDAKTGGAAMLLETALEKTGLQGKPLYLFGFSGGARFVASYVQYRPSRVAAWSVYSATEWPEVIGGATMKPPGIVACGADDHQRHVATWAFFQALRAEGWESAWMRLADTGHVFEPRLEDFTREVFEAILLKKEKKDRSPAILADNTTGKRIAALAPHGHALTEKPTEPIVLTSVLPCEDCYASWRALHTP